MPQGNSAQAALDRWKKEKCNKELNALNLQNKQPKPADPPPPVEEEEEEPTLLPRMKTAASWLRPLAHPVVSRILGATIPTAATDRLVYGGQHDNFRDYLTQGWDDPARQLGAAVSIVTGSTGGGMVGKGVRMGPRPVPPAGRKITEQLQRAHTRSRHLNLEGGLALATLAPLAERTLVQNLSASGTQQALHRAQMAGTLPSGTTQMETTEERGSNLAGPILAAGALISAPLLLATALDRWDKMKKQDEPDEDKKKNVSFEIPAHRISDNFFNRLGREILFTTNPDDPRANQSKKAASLKAPTQQDAMYASMEWNRTAPKQHIIDQIAGVAPTVARFFGVPLGDRASRHLPQRPYNIPYRVRSEFLQRYLRPLGAEVRNAAT